jgi:RNA polymerase sigma-70 factor (ECF subfamily)
MSVYVRDMIEGSVFSGNRCVIGPAGATDLMHRLIKLKCGSASQELRTVLNDIDLLRRLREQDPEAVRSLTRSYLPSIWRFVYVRVKGDEHLAEDIVSETVLALIKAVGDEVPIENPVAWMRSVAQNKVMDHFRSAARVRQLMQNVTHTTATANHDDAPSLKLHEEKREQVREIMDGLTEQHRIALEWKYLEKLSVKEIAQRWDTTEKAVESILFRARCEFREQHGEREKKAEQPNLPATLRMPANNGTQINVSQDVTESIESHH